MSKRSRSWFCVLNNPQTIFNEHLSPELMVEKAIKLWATKITRSCAVNYEIGDTGTPHMHMVLEDKNKSSFTTVQKLFKGIHIEPTKGNKKQAKDYIEKKGPFQEKKHTVVVQARYYGDIEGHQGKRNDLLDIEDMINNGMKPNEIMDLSIMFRKQDSLIRKTYFAKRYKETPIQRNLDVYWHTGESGTGKSYKYVQLCEEHGEEDVYMLNDYESGGFDAYQGEKILFMDEFKGGIRFQQLLNYLDSYKISVHARYNNVFALWQEVHVSSIYPPEDVYKKMVEGDEREADPIKQLLRRITAVIYHYKKDGIYLQHSIDMKDYTSFKKFKHSFTDDIPDNVCEGFIDIKENEDIPF